MSEWQQLIDKHATALNAAKDIFTWTSKDELAWLAEEASKRSNILEVGTYKGASAVVLANSTSGKVTCFDYCPESGIEDEARKNLQSLSNVAYVQQDAGVSAVSLRRQNKHIRFDMIWIDDGHTYQDVVRDCLIAMLFKSDYALICGHDYEKSENEVAKAVNDCFGKENVKFGPGTIWHL